MRPQAQFRAQAEDRVLQRRTTLKYEEPLMEASEMNRTVWIPANFVPAYNDVPRAQTGDRRPLGGSRTHIEYRREQVGWSDCVIDGERLQTDLQTAIEKLNSAGYDVLSITAIQSGRHSKALRVDRLGATATA